MKLIKGVPYRVISVNVSDNTQLWYSGIRLRANQQVSYARRIYQAVSEIRLDKAPNDPEYAPVMLDVGASADLRFKDELVSTQTKSRGDLRIRLNVDKGIIDRINLLNVSGSSAEIYKDERLLAKKQLRTKRAKSWSEFFTASFKGWGKSAQSIAIGQNSGELSLVIKSGWQGAALGHLSLGKGEDIGSCYLEPRVSVLDYSRKKKDDWGNISILKGKSTSLLDIKAFVPTEFVDEVKTTLQNATGELVTIVADERDRGISSLTLHGFIKEFSIVITSAQSSELSLSFEGII